MNVEAQSSQIGSDGSVLSFTGERFTPEITGQLALEHLHRYSLAKGIARGLIVLDIACGEGYGSAILAACAARVMGVDIDQGTIFHARRRYKENNLEFLVGTCSSIPLKDSSVDLVVSFETIEHHDQHDAMMVEIKRVLKPNGVLLISSPDRLVYSEGVDYSNPFHVKELSKDEFEQLLDSYFIHKRLFGQKIVYGSAILAEQNQLSVAGSDFEVSEDLGAQGGRCRPQYLLALASDSTLPPLTCGLFEAPIEQSEAIRQSLEAIQQRDTRINELLQSLQHLQRQRDDLARDCENLALSVRARELEVRQFEENSRIEEANWRRSHEAELIGLTDARSRLEHEVAARDGIIQGLVNETAGLRKRLKKLRSRLRQAEDHIRNIRASTSWRITRPIRVIKYLLTGEVSLSEVVWRIVCLLYHLVPVRVNSKENLKVSLYTTFPGVFSGLDSYRLFKARLQVAKDLSGIPTSSLPVITVVIPVYGHIDVTLQCLKSIAEYPPVAPFEVVIVDDFSPDNTRHILSHATSIRLIRNEQNAGFIRSCNLGASAARGDYLCFLNNDTQVKAGWLDELLRTFDEFPGTGLVGSKLVYPNGQLQEAGGIIWRDGSAWNYGRGQDPEHPAFNYAREVDYCSGASIMLAKKLFEELGGFDEHYVPAYGEDSDLALKIRSRGLSVIYQPMSVVIHHEGVTSGTDVTAGTKAYQIDNARKLFERWRDYLSAHQLPGDDVDGAKDRCAKWRALVVDHCTPTPDQDAGSITAFNFMLILRQMGFQVTFIPEDNYLNVPPYTQNLQRAGIEALYEPYITSVRQHLIEAGHRYDLVLLVRPCVVGNHLEGVKTLCPKAKVLFHTSDLHFIRMEREAKLDGDHSKMEAAAAMKSLELSLMRQVDEVIVHSTAEKELLEHKAPSVSISVFQWAISIRGTSSPFEARRDVAFIGGYQHPPNVDAALFFVREVFPLLRAKIPGVRFFAIGSKPPQELLELASDDVIVTGFVEDLSPLLDTLKVAVAPLRYGAGIKGKVATALSVGLPCVATEIAAEGMGLVDGREILVAQDAYDFASKVETLYKDRGLWESISREGLCFAEQTYGQGAAVRSVAAILDKLGFSASMDDQRQVVLVGPETAKRVQAPRPAVADQTVN